MNDNLHPIFKNIVNSQLQLHDVVRRSEQFVCLANGSCPYEDSEDILDCKDCPLWEENKAN